MSVTLLCCETTVEEEKNGRDRLFCWRHPSAGQALCVAAEHFIFVVASHFLLGVAQGYSLSTS